MTKQKIISLIQNSQLSTTNKKKLLAEVKEGQASAQILNDVTKALVAIKKQTQEARRKPVKTAGTKITAEEFKTREIDRLVGEKNRQLRRAYLRRMFTIIRLLDHYTNQAIKMIEEDHQKSQTT